MLKRIIIISLFVSCYILAYSQKLVSGRVMCSDNLAMPGVTVMEKGKVSGTITDSNGYYTLQVSPNAILIFSFTGYMAQEVPTGNETTVNVVFNALKTGSSGIPELEFPPPKASSRYVMDRKFFSTCRNLSKVDTILCNALQANGYTEKSYFAVPDGFAIVTRIEKMNEDGTSRQTPDRWDLTVTMDNISFKNYLKALFFENVGHYRIIVFIITDKSFNTSDKRISMEEAEGWLSTGNLTLPDIIGKKKYTEGYNIISLIYEFIKAESSSEAILSDPSGLTGMAHLNKSNILTWLQANQ
jgi:hypothetical protein